MANKINSRTKGSKNERDICKWWEKWTGYEFSRVPSSGGLRWGRTTDTTGDIICSDQKHYLRFPFSIECKSYKDINFEHLILDVKNVMILEFWDQAKSDASRGKKLPILMMRYNNMKKGEYFMILNQVLGNLVIKNIDPIQLHSIDRMVVTSKGEVIYILRASDVLANVKYRDLYLASRKILKSKK